MKQPQQRGWLVGMIVLGWLVIASVSVSAQVLSPGCSALNAPTLDANYNASSTTLTFFAGENIVITATNPSGVNIELHVPFGTVVDASVPLTYTFPATVTLTVLWRQIGGQINLWSVSCSVGGQTDTGRQLTTSGLPCAAVFDGRINNVPELDCAPPVAVYDEGDYFALYGIDPVSGRGELVMRIQKDDLSDAPGENVLLEAGVHPYTGHPVLMSQLQDGELQVNATYADSKLYIFTFSQDGKLIEHLAA